LVNDVKSEETLEIDPNGDETIDFLINTRKILQRISGNHPSSLGLHPACIFTALKDAISPHLFWPWSADQGFPKEKIFRFIYKEPPNYRRFYLEIQGFRPAIK